MELIKIISRERGKKGHNFYMLLLDCFTQIMKDKRNEEWKTF